MPDVYNVIVRLVRCMMVVALVAVAVFLLLRLSPGDPAVLYLGPGATAADIADLRERLGLNSPLHEQLLLFIRDLLHGDLGTSISYRRPVLGLALSALPATFILGLTAFALSLLIAIPAGVVAAAKQGSMTDSIIRMLTTAMQSLPTFWIGIMLIFVFALRLRWLPTSGRGGWQYLILPALTLSSYQWALLTQVVRSSMIEALNQDYVLTAKAKGLSYWEIVWRHAFRNTGVQIVTVLALQLGTMLSGAVITEAVFAWPGIGTLGVSAIAQRDYALVQAIVIVGATTVVLLTAIADTAAKIIDRRIA